MKFNFKTLLLSLLVCAGAFSSQAQFVYINTIAGDGTEGYYGDGKPGTEANLHAPISITLDPSGNVYFVDYLNYCIRRIATDGTITLFAGVPDNGGYAGNGGFASSANMWPHGIIMDQNYNMYVSELSGDVIRKITPNGIINHFAGLTENGYTGDGGLADTCRMNFPFGLAVDNIGDVFFADAANNVVREIDTAGYIYTVAGNGLAGYGGDGLPAVDALLDSPFDVAVDKYGNLYISDTKNNVIRYVDNTSGLISTFAGTGVAGYNMDTIPATTALLNYPAGITLDTAGNLYIADAHNNMIRMVDNSGTIRRLAGNRTYGFGGDLGLATDANLADPYAVAVDTFGNMYIADANNQRIRKTYSALGVPTVNKTQDISIYPNPFNNQVFVDGLVIGDKIAMFNIIGNQVSELTEITNAGGNAVTIGADLPAGIYMLQVWDANGNKKSVVKVTRQ